LWDLWTFIEKKEPFGNGGESKEKEEEGKKKNF
jgi:hypothetical protein